VYDLASRSLADIDAIHDETDVTATARGKLRDLANARAGVWSDLVVAGV